MSRDRLVASETNEASSAVARLARQRLAGAQVETAYEVVAAFGALQAQDYGNMLWAIGVRTAEQTRAQVEAALAAGKIVRSWPLRGTLHVTTAEDIRSLLRLSAPYALAKSANRRVNLALTQAVLKRAEKIVVRALQGGTQATRDELAAALTRGGVAVDGQRTYHLLFYFGLQGLTCFGPHRGKEPTFVLLDEWVPGWPAAPEEEVLAQLAVRYLATRAPATPQDFAWWTGLPIPRARAALASVQTLPPTNTAATTSALLLPGFDEYVLSYRNRSAVLSEEHAKAIVPGANGIFLPMIVVDGRIVGTWKRTQSTKQTTVSFAPFVPLSARATRGLRAALKRYGAFLERPVALG